MNEHEGDENLVVMRGRSINSSRPSTRQSDKDQHDCINSRKCNDATTQVSQKIRVSSALKRLKAKEKCPTDIEALPDPAFGQEIMQRDSRPKSSASNVLQYADVPIEITPHHLGRPTRATILRNLKRAQSASSVCSDLSWIQDNRRLCNIRDYYRLSQAKKIWYDTPKGEPIHSYLTGARFNGAHWLDSHSLKTEGLYINKQNLKNVFLLPKPPFTRSVDARHTKRGQQLLEIKGKGIMKDACVNTEDYYLAINKWHGADWQSNLPEMYQPVKEKYNPYASVVVRAKRVQSEYRDPIAMVHMKARSKSVH